MRAACEPANEGIPRVATRYLHMVRNTDITQSLLLDTPLPHRVEREALANAGGLTSEQARWLQKTLVFHGVCVGNRQAESHPVVDLRQLPTALRALDVTRMPLSRDQKARVRIFMTQVHTAALARPLSLATRSGGYRPPPPLPCLPLFAGEP